MKNIKYIFFTLLALSITAAASYASFSGVKEEWVEEGFCFSTIMATLVGGSVGIIMALFTWFFLVMIIKGDFRNAFFKTIDKSSSDDPEMFT